MAVNKLEKFIDKACLKHSNKYDYSKVNYINGITKVEIICPIHGSFWQQPGTHLQGAGCPKCGGVYRYDTKSFIEAAKKIHGDKYDYSKVEYKNAHTKVEIVCPIHGSFWQSPNSHISSVNKCGCPQCSMNRYPTSGRFKKRSFEDVIEAAKKIHGDKYTYDPSTFKNMHTPMEIICPDHGEFWQAPSTHIHGKAGCPACRESKGERAIRLWLTKHKVKYEAQKSFPGCANVKPLHFDFYLPDYNMCIEFDGLQHFIEDDFYTKVNKLDYIQHCDSIKTDYCKNNNIRLLRIPYNELNRVNKILKEEVKWEN